MKNETIIDYLKDINNPYPLEFSNNLNLKA